LIEENLTAYHRLIFNKFINRNYHVLIVTKDAKKQKSLLNEEDFKASLIVMKSLDGVLFYNGGKEAGAS